MSDAMASPSLSELLTLLTLVVATVGALAAVIQVRLMLYAAREPHYQRRRPVDLAELKPWMIREMDRKLAPLLASVRNRLVPHMAQRRAADLADEVLRATYVEIIGRVDARERFLWIAFRWKLRKAVERNLLAELVRRQEPEATSSSVPASQ